VPTSGCTTHIQGSDNYTYSIEIYNENGSLAKDVLLVGIFENGVRPISANHDVKVEFLYSDGGKGRFTWRGGNINVGERIKLKLNIQIKRDVSDLNPIKQWINYKDINGGEHTIWIK
jgi:hypothetical protein